MNDVTIIAEAGVNHNGSLDLARELASAAREAGADFVKFQIFRAEQVIAAGAPKADYQKKSTDSEIDQLDMVRKLELSFEDHKTLANYCGKIGIPYISTPFDIPSADYLIHEIGVSIVKIPSGEITNAPLIHHIAKTGVDIILSTGMSTLGDIENALGVIACAFLGTEPSRENFAAAYQNDNALKILEEKVSLLHCTSEYPAPFSDVHLPVINMMREAFGLRTGYSDHTTGIAVPMAAVALGAEIIEKHFTLDRALPGPDHQASLEPGELKQMIEGIRNVTSALKPARKIPTASERKNLPIARKSLVAAAPISAGDVFTERNVTAKRPGDGLSPLHFWDLLGRKASRAYSPDERISADEIFR